MIRTTEFKSNGSRAWVAAALSAALLCGGAGVARADDVSALDAVRDAAPGALTSVAQVTQGSGDNILSVKVADASIQIPVDGSDPLVIKGSATSPVSITLPFAGQAQDAALESPGIVSYDNGNSSQTVPAIKTDGKLQIATVIENAQSPRDYAYNITTPSGGTLVPVATGEVVVLDGNGSPSAVIDRPWAKDANGKSVPTSYSISGSTLTQHVDLSSTDIAYPVVADPTLIPKAWGQIIKLSKSETKSVASKIGGAGASAAFCGLIPAPYSVPCAAVVGWKSGNAISAVKEAAAQGRCAQLNLIPLSPILSNVSNEKC